MAPASTEQSGRTVQVVPLLRLHHLGHRRFDYVVPTDADAAVAIGSVVYVPFGRRTVRAVVVADEGSSSAPEMGLRPIHSATPQKVPAALLRLAERVSERYLASFESCLRLVVPPEPGAGGSGAGRSGGRWVMRTDVSSEGLSLTVKQRSALDSAEQGASPVRVVCERAGVGRSVVRALIDKGLLALCDPPSEPARGSSCAAENAFPRSLSATMPSLWPGQAAAVRELLAAYDDPAFARRLLWGVTGSGKTEVYLRLIARALERDESAILLVPEIALTPQTIARVRERFGPQVAALHSGLSRKERVGEYERIASGQAKIVVGARSAVFAPVVRLGLVIVDEAHESSYKQEEEPRYHAVEVAAMRLAETGGLLLEGTATPSVESAYAAGAVVRLARRALGEEPPAEVVDMRRQGPGLLLAPYAREALAATMRRGEQAIVLLNRRGYAAYVHCDMCGYALVCRDCEVTLTYHSRSRRLVCHHCGRTYEQPLRCPSCGEGPLTRGSPGTERLARELKALVPREQVFQMDSDVTAGGRRVQRLLESFACTHPAVLLGTQMVAKGHDFPDVTLVLVADADTGLYLPDFRAAERTFQLLRQVAGRAGRAGKPGRVVVQTWNPDVPCIRMALEQEEDLFYQEELRARRRLGYPPFTQMVRLVTVAREPDRAQAAASYLAERLAPHLRPKELWGPSRLSTLRGKARWHVLVAGSDGERVRRLVGKAVEQLTLPYRRRGVLLLVDVDPYSFG